MVNARLWFARLVTVYALLIFSFLALVLACVLMYLELDRYGHDLKAKEYRKSSMRPVISEVWRDMA